MAIEQQTGKAWNRVVEEKPDKAEVAKVSVDIALKGHSVILNVNNHYEGSAPLTIGALRALLAGRLGRS